MTGGDNSPYPNPTTTATLTHNTLPTNATTQIQLLYLQFQLLKWTLLIHRLKVMLNVSLVYNVANNNAGNTDTPNTIPHLFLTASFIVYIPRCGSDWV